MSGSVNIEEHIKEHFCRFLACTDKQPPSPPTHTHRWMSVSISIPVDILCNLYYPNIHIQPQLISLCNRPGESQKPWYNMKCAARTRRHHFVWMEWNGGIHSSTATALQAWCVFCFRGRRSDLLTLHASRVTAGVEQWVKRTRGNIMSSTYIVNVAAGDSKSLCDAIWRLNDLDRVAFPEEGQFQWFPCCVKQYALRVKYPQAGAHV